MMAMPWRSQHVTVKAISAVGALVISLGGCSLGTGAQSSAVKPSSSGSRTSAATSTASLSIQSPASMPLTCHVKTPRSLLAALKTAWSRRPGDRRLVIPFDGSSHGDRVVVQAQQGHRAWIGLENLSSHRISTIQRLTNASVPVTGMWNGTTAVWVEYRNPEYDQFTVWSWKVGEAPRLLGRSAPAEASGGYSAGIYWPALSRSYAAWIRPTGPGGVAQLVEANLATGQTRLIAQGHVADPVYYDGLLVWGQALQPKAKNVAQAAVPETGAPRRPPIALASERGGYSFATSGGAIAFLTTGPSGAGGVTYYAASPQQPARPVFTIRGAGAGLNSVIQLDGSLISATGYNHKATPGDWIISGTRGSSYFIPYAGAVTANATDLFFPPERVTPGDGGTQYPLGNIAARSIAGVPTPGSCS